MQETDTKTKAAVTAWSRLIRVSAALLASVEADLKAASLPPLNWYDALLELNRQPGAGLKPSELQKEMLLQQYNVSRLVDRLEGQGLVERKPDPADGRGQILFITPTGRDMLKKMWPVYRSSLEHHVAQRLSLEDAEALAGLLGRLAPQQA